MSGSHPGRPRTVTLTSNNVRSFHAYDLFSTKFNKASNARSLAAMVNIQLYQETRFNPLEDHYLRDPPPLALLTSTTTCPPG